jgi:Na+/H+ antiporter NhaD/arsenite permease-like protein
MNFITAPIIADLFLLAIGAIGGKEVRQGILGANDISPLDIMLFFITLAYIAISIDASGLIRFLAFKVLQKGQSDGRRLFIYLYAFFFALTTCIGNDPVILSGTAFLAYMTRVAKDMPPRAWIFSQFAVANIGSAILVSSNPTNLVLAGAFKIRFIYYTANMVVPAVVTAVVLLPFLFYFVFNEDEGIENPWIPSKIEIHELPRNIKELPPMNPNMPRSPEQDNELLMHEEVLNPFLDGKSAIVGSVVMAVTLAAVLALNAASNATGEHPVFLVTLPAAFIMFCWDIGYGWVTRKAAQQTAQDGAEQRRRALKEDEAQDLRASLDRTRASMEIGPTTAMRSETEKTSRQTQASAMDEKDISSSEAAVLPKPKPTNLVDSFHQLVRYLRKTFPTTMAVFSHLPFALIPFAFAMFILVQALVSKTWVATFAYGWKHWVDKTGVVGAIAGMGFLSVILCNVSSHLTPSLPHADPFSSPEQISAQLSSSLVSSRRGKRSTTGAALVSRDASTGPPSTAWPLGSTTVPLVPLLVPPLLGFSGRTSSRGKRSPSAALSLQGSTSQSLACRWSSDWPS